LAIRKTKPKMRNLFIAALAIATVPAFAQSLAMTELLYNPSGTDTGYEWIEIQGTPGAVVNNLWLVSIEGDTGASSQGVPGEQGAVDVKKAVPSFVLGSNGLALIRQVTPSNPSVLPFLAGSEADAATTIVALDYSYLNTASGGGTVTDLENGSNTFLVVQSANPFWTSLTDIDVDNDGVPDSGITGLFTVVGAFGVRDGFTGGNATDKSYGAAFGGHDSPFSNPAFVYRVLTTGGAPSPGHVSGFQSTGGGTNFNSGPFTLTAADFSTVLPAMTNLNLPRLSPGRKNLEWFVGTSTISGNLVLENTADDGAAGTETITWTLSNGVNSYTSDFTVNDFGGGAYSFDIPAAAVNGNYTLSFDGGTFLKSTYNVTLSGSSLTQAVSLRNGDIDNDAEVGPSDFEAVVAQFGGPGDADVDNDGEVGPSDFEIIVANFGLGDN
jgi:hypothetical protein